MSDQRTDRRTVVALLLWVASNNSQEMEIRDAKNCPKQITIEKILNAKLKIGDHCFTVQSFYLANKPFFKIKSLTNAVDSRLE